MTDTPDHQPLRPAAQAVMIAATNGNTNVVNDPVYRQCIAAALRAAADQVALKCPEPKWSSSAEQARWFACNDVRDELLAIAAELEGAKATGSTH